jgi:hypothetical protein
MKGRQIENAEVRVSVESFAKELELDVVSRGRGEIVLSSISVSRPGLQLSGYFVHFDKTRVQVIGNAENEYLVGLSKEKRVTALENLIKRDIVNAINSKLEATILGSAAGTSTQPKGIFNVAEGDSLKSIANYADICELESDVADANINGDCKYVLSNKAKAALRGMIKGTNNTGMVYEHNQVDGTEAFNTSHVEGKNIAYGDWSNLAIGQWGAINYFKSVA